MQRRLRCRHQIVEREIPVRYAIHRVCSRTVKIQSRRRELPVIRKAGSCKRRSAQRTYVQTFSRGRKAAAVTSEHLVIGEQVMAHGRSEEHTSELQSRE